MTRDEIRGLGRLLGHALGGGSAVVQEMHRGIAERVFTSIGTGGTAGAVAVPVRAVHDAVADVTYQVVRGATTAVPAAGGAVAAAIPAAEGDELASSRSGRLAQGAINGLYGDFIARRTPELALSMSLHTASGARGVPDQPSGRVAVFVHGLCENDRSWFRSSQRHYDSPATSYGTRLADDLAFTPLYLRYNTGLHVSDNGRQLSRTLDELVRTWPLEVEEIVLVGHSMGGLVVRSACHYGKAEQAAWTDVARHVFCLASPHLGAPLEQGVNVLSWALARLPETRAVSTVLNARSSGVKDMRFGSCAEEEWSGCDPDEFLRDRSREVPFLDTATYYFVGATLTADPGHPLGSIVGDLLVPFPSAAGQGRRRRIPFGQDKGHHLGGLDHFGVLNHPGVYELLHTWLSAAGRASRAVPPCGEPVPAP